ncbi:MAG: hypothetical protein GY927_09375 [bacterium]|nr:hypothetical protein [bacterium]
MNTNENAPAATEATHQKPRSNLIKKGTKRHGVISHFVSGGSPHRFQAERLCHDHTLNSTVSDFQRQYGIPVARELIVVRGFAGRKTTVARYFLTPDAQKAAAKLLEQEVA